MWSESSVSEHLCGSSVVTHIVMANRGGSGAEYTLYNITDNDGLMIHEYLHQYDMSLLLLTGI